MVLAVLRASEAEGEDLTLGDLIEALLTGGPLLPAGLLADLRRDYGHLPPRIALSMMARDPRWREAVLRASRTYLAELVEGW